MFRECGSLIDYSDLRRLPGAGLVSSGDRWFGGALYRLGGELFVEISSRPGEALLQGHAQSGLTSKTVD